MPARISCHSYSSRSGAWDESNSQTIRRVPNGRQSPGDCKRQSSGSGESELPGGARTLRTATGPQGKMRCAGHPVLSPSGWMCLHPHGRRRATRNPMTQRPGRRQCHAAGTHGRTLFGPRDCPIPSQPRPTGSDPIPARPTDGTEAPEGIPFDPDDMLIWRART